MHNFWIPLGFLEIVGTQTSTTLRGTTEVSQVSASEAGMYIPPEVPENVLGVLDATVLLEIRSRCSEFLSSVKSCITCMQEQKQKPNDESLYAVNENVVLLWFGDMRCC